MEKAISEAIREQVMILKEIAKVVDCPHSTAPDEGEGYPLIRTPNIGRGRFILDGVHRVSEEVYHLRNRRIVPDDGDIIFAREAPAGNAAIIKNGLKVCLGQRTVLIRPNKEKVNPDYLVYYILSPLQQAKLLGYAHGATVGHVNIPDIENLEIRLPDLLVQEKIAGVITAYDSLIELNNKRIKLLTQMAENLYKEWFVRFRFPGHETAEFENGVPKGWKIDTADNLYDISIGKTPSRKEFEWFTSNDENAVDWLSISDMKDVFVMKTSEQLTKEAIDNFNMFVVPAWTVMLSFKLTVGRVCFTSKPTASNEAIAHFKNVPENAREYLFCYLKYFDYSKLGNTSAIGNAVNSKIIKNMKITVPDEGVLNSFHDISNIVFSNILKLMKANENLIKQRDLLLPRLMSGKLEV